jgi:hypothetical protein
VNIDGVKVGNKLNVVPQGENTSVGDAPPPISSNAAMPTLILEIGCSGARALTFMPPQESTCTLRSCTVRLRGDSE